MGRVIKKKHSFSPDFHYIIKHVLSWDNKMYCNVASSSLTWSWKSD